jgi:hypothetical protein
MDSCCDQPARSFPRCATAQQGLTGYAHYPGYDIPENDLVRGWNLQLHGWVRAHTAGHTTAAHPGSHKQGRMRNAVQSV